MTNVDFFPSSTDGYVGHVSCSSQITGLVIALATLFKGRLCCFPKDPLEDVETWGESVDKVLSSTGNVFERKPRVYILVFGHIHLAFKSIQSERSETNCIYVHLKLNAVCATVLHSWTDSLPRVPKVGVQRGEHTVLAGL